MVSMNCSICKKKIKKGEYKKENWSNATYWCDDCLEEEKRNPTKIVGTISFNDLFDKELELPGG